MLCIHFLIWCTVKPVTNCNSVKGSCYYGVTAIWEVFMEKVNFNQKIIGGKLGREWWIAWISLLQRWEEGIFSFSFFLIRTTEERIELATGYGLLVRSLGLLMKVRRGW